MRTDHGSRLALPTQNPTVERLRGQGSPATFSAAIKLRTAATPPNTLHPSRFNPHHHVTPSKKPTPAHQTSDNLLLSDTRDEGASALLILSPSQGAKPSSTTSSSRPRALSPGIHIPIMMDEFASDTDSDYTSYWRDWVSRASPVSSCLPSPDTSVSPRGFASSALFPFSQSAGALVGTGTPPRRVDGRGGRTRKRRGQRAHSQYWASSGVPFKK